MPASPPENGEGDARVLPDDVVGHRQRLASGGSLGSVRNPATITERATHCGRAVISGDTLADFGRGLEINEKWRRPGVTREEIAAGLRPLLELPVEHVLATHGGPTDRAALERALSAS
jgi:hypothetical protein